MRGWNTYERLAVVGAAVRLVAGTDGALSALAARSPSPSRSPQTVRSGDRREVKPIAPDLVVAIRNADTSAVRKLLDNGVEVNARDAEGNTPLILASFYASPVCVKLLIEKGADVN